jgi:hypothetical protein
MIPLLPATVAEIGSAPGTGAERGGASRIRGATAGEARPEKLRIPTEAIAIAAASSNGRSISILSVSVPFDAAAKNPRERLN